MKVFYKSIFKTQTSLLPRNSGEQIKSLGLFLSSSLNLSGSYYSIKLQFKNDVTCSTCSPTRAEMPALSQSLFSSAQLGLNTPQRRHQNCSWACNHQFPIQVAHIMCGKGAQYMLNTRFSQSKHQIASVRFIEHPSLKFVAAMNLSARGSWWGA